jgi:nucleotide-binding universal stress UspA family protein
MALELLVPLDGSPQSEAVFPMVQALAQRCQARATLLRCYEPISAIYTVPDMISLETYTAFDESLPGSMLAYLEAKQSELGEAVHKVLVRQGGAAQQIIAVAESEAVDLVVMASHGRRGLEKLWLGGVTTKVVRSSTRPVLVVAGADIREPSLESVMVALDGSACSERAFQAAYRLAMELRAELVLYQAVQMPWDAHDPQPEMDQAQAYLQSLADRCQGISVRVRAYPTDGPPYIVERAEELGADLLVMGSHGRGALERFLLGSQTERVLQQGRMPVLVVH